MRFIFVQNLKKKIKKDDIKYRYSTFNYEIAINTNKFITNKLQNDLNNLQNELLKI